VDESEGIAAQAGPLARVRFVSLDIVVGVLSAAAFAATAVRVSMPTGWWLVLPLATWVIYSTDHLLDVRHRDRVATPHHRFYLRQFRPLLALTAVGTFSTLGLALWLLPVRLLVVGTVIGVAATGYLVLAQTPRFRIVPKEIAAAAIYTAGIWFGPYLSGRPEQPGTWLLMLVHLLAALANLVAYSLFEGQSDRKGSQRSLVRDWGEIGAVSVLGAASVSGTLLAMAGMLVGPARLVPYHAVLLLLVQLPLAMWYGRRYFARRQRYRVVGDLAFLAMLAPAIAEVGYGTTVP
jgi:4-hydroxybenzoate polyprenyltransferase